MRPRILAAAGLTAVALSLSACGGDHVGTADVAARLKTDPEFSGLPAKARECVAALMVKRVDGSDLKKYVEGKKRLDDLRGDENNLDAEMGGCLTRS